jgi:polyisoprenoid-binding protein YceI
MKKTLIIITLLVFSAAVAWILYNKYRIVIPPVDTAKSEIGWSAKSVSDTHFGKVQLSKATLEFKNSKLVGGTFEIDMNTITAEDITDPENNQHFIQHITTEHFFETDRFPTASFVIVDVQPINESDYTVKGNITIKGITVEIQFKAKVIEVSNVKTASATIVLNKNVFGIEYGGKDKPGSEKDWFIYDEFTLNVNIVSE